jgi:hypothetical protein
VPKKAIETNSCKENPKQTKEWPTFIKMQVSFSSIKNCVFPIIKN